ncbi:MULTISPECIES: DJ-1/PfpI family protein [unclassified Streptomyces]|uniref:DJ-1/PfpI family protein n=1 Tax=unclassified Streptomyces TaxID=2593676 RepID=UPI000DB9E78D|nr:MULTISPECIES: DJ-1/PfpI family protein [unclassified Streptomyces]MYT68989.1 DJ-1/PfpI family protein [Streptomyces sp. SID8367]RAJ82497.1 DJ-1/PfpI family protein [Streptomyces sp. PsTaAH-137]
MHVQIVLFDGFDPLDVIGPYEVLHAGGAASDGAVSVELVSAEGPREVVGGTGGLALRATAALDPARSGVVLVPGAAGRVGAPDEVPDPDAAEPSIPVLLGRTLTTGLPALLRAVLDRPGTILATVCGGALVPAMAGLLEGRHATTHHLGLDLLDATGAHAVHARIVDDGDLVSAGAVTSGLDLGLYLLEREVGPRIAHAVEELFAHERRGTVWHPRGPLPAAF